MSIFAFDIFSLVFQRWHLKKWTLYDKLFNRFLIENCKKTIIRIFEEIKYGYFVQQLMENID